MPRDQKMGKEGPQVAPCFPVTRATVNRFLIELGQSVSQNSLQIPKTNSFIEDQPVLAGAVGVYMQELDKHGFSSYTDQFSIGALTAYGLLRMQAESNGGELIQVSLDTLGPSMHDVEYLKNTSNSSNTFELFAKSWDKINNYDRELAEAVSDTAKLTNLDYHTKAFFYFGAYNIFALLKNAYEADKLRKMLG